MMFLTLIILSVKGQFFSPPLLCKILGCYCLGGSARGRVAAAQETLAWNGSMVKQFAVGQSGGS